MSAGSTACALMSKQQNNAVVDPGFPIGGHQPRRGDADSLGSYVSKILYVETKESGPIGGTPPRSTNAICVPLVKLIYITRGVSIILLGELNVVIGGEINMDKL